MHFLKQYIHNTCVGTLVYIGEKLGVC